MNYFIHLYIQFAVRIKWICIQNKISPNAGTLLNGVLTPKLFNSSFASWFLINLDFLLPHIAHFDNMVFLPLLVFETLGFMFPVSFLNFKQYDFILYKMLPSSVFRHEIYYLKLLLIISLRLITSLIPISFSFCLLQSK